MEEKKEANKEFQEADKKFEEIDNKNLSKVELRKKTFMKISDVAEEDAQWFKNWCDKHTDRKQFLGIKVIRNVMERLDPLLTNVLTQINDLNGRIDYLENTLQQPVVEEEPKLQIPKTQGIKRVRQ